MAGQKFFSGLTDAMINRASADRPDRQKSNFYWPDEYMQDSQDTFRTSNGNSGASSRRPSTASSSATATPKDCMSPIGASTVTLGESAEVLKQRHRSNARSHIEFYDDCDSSFSALEREKQRTKLGIEKFLREQDDDVSEMAKNRRQNTLKSNFHFNDFEEPQTPRASSRQQNSNGYHHPVATTPDYPEDHRFSPINGGPVQSLRRQQSSPVSSEYHYSARYTGSYDDEEFDRYSCRSNDYGFSPPGTPFSGGGDVPEHKRNSQRHLRSSIAFSNGVAIAEDDTSSNGSGRKPVSVRDAAATQRVGVGLPNL
uniref:Uncharacterized protein n=1 Tax=Culex tarsalis TaxID=7177 RepID=A0A1Q3FDQ7_CULTA